MDRMGGRSEPEGRAESAASEDRYRLALEAAGHVYFEYDPRSARIVAGAPWTVLGYATDEVAASMEAWMSLVHPDDRPTLAEGMGKQHRGRAPGHRIEYRMRAKDGAWRAVLVSTRALARDPDGIPLRTVGTITDVTEARALRERLLLADRLASLGTLAGGVAHAVNNPLASVAASVRILGEELERAAADPARLSGKLAELRLAAADAARGAERVGEVVRALQVFAAPRASGPREPADVRAELEVAVELTRNALAQRARLAVDLPRALPRVIAARGELGHAFVNLLLTTTDALPEGQAGEHEVRVSARASGSQLVIEVVLEGTAIPAEHLQRLFEPYYGTDASRSGGGLGLSVSHGLVQAAGGAIEASGDRRTTTFRITLPAAPAPTAQEGPIVPTATTEAKGRVLVVDDDPLVGRSMARLLRATHDVTVLSSPAEAVSRIERGERWDVVLCDLMMPELSGMDVEERVAKVAPDLVSRMVYLTGGAFTDRARAFLGAGRPFLEKPVEASTLRAKVAELLRRGPG